jgi:integrase
MARKMTDLGVRAIRARSRRFAVPDPELRGHWIRVQPSGAKTYVAVTRDPNGRQLWTTIAATDLMSIDAAREQARTILQRVRAGKPAVEPKPETFGAIVAAWLTRHVEKNGLRSAHEVRRLLDTHVLPAWGERDFLSIRRSDVAALLDHVEDEVSAHQADACLKVVRSLMNWYATRADDYAPPIVRHMARQSPHAMARSRVLTDDELRKIWTAADSAESFGAVVKICLLTAQRKSKVIDMRWSELEGGEWAIPKAPREKGNAGVLVLAEVARAIIDAQPRFASNPHVFAGRVAGPISGLSKRKAHLDRVSGVTGWRLHDLRRTARSLMARAGVLSEHAERVMGHVIGGVEGTYNRFEYRQEKADALQRLANLVDDIVHEPAPVNVVSMGKRQR